MHNEFAKKKLNKYGFVLTRRQMMSNNLHVTI